MSFVNIATKIKALKYRIMAYLIIAAIIGGLGWGCKFFYTKTIELENQLATANERIEQLVQEQEKIKRTEEVTEASILAILKGDKKVERSASKVELAVQDKIEKINKQYTKVVAVNNSVKYKPSDLKSVDANGGALPYRLPTIGGETAEKVAEVAVVTEYENLISGARIEGLWTRYCEHTPKGSDPACDKFDTQKEPTNQIEATPEKAPDHEEFPH